MNLSITDNQDGTGVIATIASSSGGSVTFYYQSVTGTSWTSGGSRTGDGNISVSLDDGYYWGYSIEGSTISNVVYFWSTTNDNSVHYRCLVAAQAKIQSLNLEGIESRSIRFRKFPIITDFKGNSRDYNLPALILCPFGQETVTPATNSRDDISYPVTLSLIVSDEAKTRDLEENISTYLKWREQIERAFRFQRLSGVTEIYNTIVEPNAIYSPDVFQQGLWSSYMTIKFISREIRG